MYSTSSGSVRESFEMCGLFSVACTISSVVDFGNRDIASVYLFCFIASITYIQIQKKLLFEKY